MLGFAHDEGMVMSMLGRVQSDLPMDVASKFAGKTCLVTGGGGSIGSALCVELARCGVSRLVVVDSCEFNLYAVDHVLGRDHRSVDSIPVLADVTCVEELERVFEAYHFDYVFHAAASKHVPMVEHNPLRGVKVNVVGTKTVLDLCERYHAGAFLLVSTDKAVNPTNFMGASKRLAEKVVLSGNRAIPVKAVRFGNVLWSSGSVLPLFAAQLREGRPVTLTDDRVTRYFMSVREAVQLILRASAMPDSGVYVFDMGTPVVIRDVIDRLAAWMGVSSYEVQVVGLRPGEKLYEELTLGDGLCPTHDDKISMAGGEDHQLSATILGEVLCALSSADSLALRRALLDAGLGYMPSSPVVDPIWTQQARRHVVPIHGDSNEYLWMQLTAKPI